MGNKFQPGIDVLCRDHADWIDGARVGLVCHPASVSADGTHSSALLQQRKNIRLTCLFGAEHGVLGYGNAGEMIGHTQHPRLQIPIYSLYGKSRKPTQKMLKQVDVIVFDLQTLAARCYTYISTLRYIIEGAAEAGKTVVVADRPDPLSCTVDGPMLNRRFQSFVALVPSPVVYGMTPGEAAQWLKKRLRLKLDLRIAKADGYGREAFPLRAWPHWQPPSPSILNWQSGLCFPITVFFEALPGIDHGRGTGFPFEVVGAPRLDNGDVCKSLQGENLPGVSFAPCEYLAQSSAYRRRRLQGIRISVSDPHAYRPVRTAVSLISALQQACPAEQLWKHPEARPGFFDQLMGAGGVRRELQRGVPPDEIASHWEPEVDSFLAVRSKFLLYA